MARPCWHALKPMPAGIIFNHEKDHTFGYGNNVVVDSRSATPQMGEKAHERLSE